jgi:hypothetical protein
MIPGMVTTEYTEHTENRFCTGGNGGNGEPTGRPGRTSQGREIFITRRAQERVGLYAGKKTTRKKLNPADSSVDSHHVNPPNARTGLNDVIINPVELNILIGGKNETAPRPHGRDRIWRVRGNSVTPPG